MAELGDMTHRERFAAALAGRPVDRTPVVCRLDLWHNAGKLNGTLPPELQGLSLEAIQLKLGMAVSARKGCVFAQKFREPARYERLREGASVIERYHLPSGMLERVSQYEGRDEAIGISPRICQYPLCDPRDYDLYIELMDHIEYEPTYDRYRAYDQQIGDNGYPMVAIGPIPAHDLMLRWIGYEESFYLMADDAPRFDAVVAAGEAAMRRMWPIVADSPAELVMHGVNFSTMISPPLFERYFLPYLSAFNQMLHSRQKRGVFHGDGDMSALLTLALDAGFDVADCLACAPLVPLTLQQAFDAWRGRIVIWGGIPSPLLEATTSDREFEAHLVMVRDLSREGGFIAGICDQAMPAAKYDRIAKLAEYFG